MQPLPDVWVHRRPKGATWGPLDERSGRRAAPPTQWTHVLSILTRNEFRARYRSQALGILWSLVNPLVQMAILSVIFSHVAAFKSEIPNYPVYLLVGVVVWQWFSTATNTATQAFITHADIVKRTVFSRHLLPLATALSYAINFAMESLLVLALVAVWPRAFSLSPALALVPVIVLVLALLIGAVSIITSVLNVIYRDVAFLVSTGLTLLYWLTPIIYPVSFVPPKLLPLYQMNPVGSILIALRNCVIDGTMPSALTWAGMMLPTLAVLGIAWAVFRHYERMVLDYV